VAYVNLVCYYVIGVTVGCVLGFKTSLGVAVSLNNSLTDFSFIFGHTMNLIVIFIGHLVGNDPWSFHTDCCTNNFDCQNKLGCRGIQNFCPTQ